VCADNEFFERGKCVPCSDCSTSGLFAVDKCTRLKDSTCVPLGDAVSVANTGVLVLKKGIYAAKGTCGGIVDKQRQITIEAPDGAENTIIDCSAEPSRHFDVMAGSTLVIRGVTLLYGGSETLDQGGCIRVTGTSATLTMVDVVMSGCMAEYGGAIYASGGATVSVRGGSLLTQNSAIQDGGCVYGMEYVPVIYMHIFYAYVCCA
jgi:hypothetical protein